MLRNTFLRTLREYRAAIIWWSLGIGVLMASSSTTYSGLFTSGSNRAKQLADLQAIGNSFSFMLGQAIDLDNFGGFVTYRYLSILPIIVGIFLLLMGSNLIRGEEERGALDLLLSTPHSRASVLLQKWAAMLVAISIIGLVAALALLAGVARTPEYSLDAQAVLLSFVGFVLGVLFFGTLALAISQFTSRRTAASVTGGVMAVTYLLNNLTLNAPSIDWLKYFTPFYYITLNKPLSPSIGASWVGLAVIAVLNLLLLAASLFMYQNRDHNGYFRFTATTAQPARQNSVRLQSDSLWLQDNFWFGLRSGLRSAVIWGVCIAIYMGLVLYVLGSVREQIISLLQNDLYRNLGFQPTDESLVSISLFVYGSAIYAAFAVLQVASWSSEETGGRLELVLSTPQPRWQVLLRQLAASALNCLVLVLLTGALFGLEAVLVNVRLNIGNVVAAFAGLWVICLIVLGFGFVLTALGPTWATLVTGLVVGVSFLTDLFTSLFKLPDWVAQLSIFRQYGQPLITGPNWLPYSIMLALAALFTALAIVRFNQRDLVK